MNLALVKLSSLGDVVHSLPVAVTLRAALPGIRLTWVAERREAALLDGHPAVDEVAVLDTRGWRCALGSRHIVEVGRALVLARRRLRAGRFDVALDLQGLLKSGLVTAATGAPVRIGFAADACRERLSALFTNRRVTPPPEARHVVDQYLSLLTPLGITAPVREFRLPVDARAEAAIDEFFVAAGLKPRDRIVVLNPGARRAEKRWPAERFCELASRLSEEAAAKVLVVWGPGEQDGARAIVDASRRGAAILASPTDLAALRALLRRGTVVVAGDTGPLHLAAALERPCVGLYGPTSASRNGPYGQAHRALQSPDGVMAGLGVDAVFRAVTELLA